MRQKICGWFFVFLMTLAGWSAQGFGADIDIGTVTLATRDRPVEVQRFAVRGEGRRPAVILLHGRQGLDLFRVFYQRTAAAIAAAGFDVYLFPYYDDDDIRQLKSADAAERRAYFNRRIGDWSALVGDAIGDILGRPTSSGRIGLIGFSQGGFLAVSVAGRDPRVSGLVVYYGGIPGLLKVEATHLPPLLEFHGDADRRVAIQQGRELTDWARQLGGPAEMVVYPGAGHGFGRAATADAERRSIAFFKETLSDAKP
ncbi:dienelactone hydrolase family protein [Telmatospirillum siberiense]|uniref:Carboxymethylenebutenolidase n=1 Tax=Telmatospirillum siberiense TaxID=382514 RepID=A0A2N3PUN9_9PROT|nr:dienelactone hydrolase family protein [Telmatospirillum siberiense]PKU24114.1 carboxymethylenebutenolidase [Telmatospirillum siberiense]